MALYEDSLGEIRIRYDGLEAAEHVMDMSALGESMQGMAKVISTLATFVMTHRYVSTENGLVVRLKAKAPEANCVTLAAVWDFIGQQQVFSGAGAGVLTTLFAWLVGRSRDGKQEMKHLSAALESALQLMAQGNKDQLDRLLTTMERMADGLRPAMRQAVEPVGRFCSTMSVKGTVVDEDAARDIRDHEPEFITPAGNWTVVLTELDIEKMTAKVRIEPGEERRVAAVLLDPAARALGNPYVDAFARGVPLTVRGKAGLRDDVLRTLYISEALPTPLGL